jgi:hypothetical protein
MMWNKLVSPGARHCQTKPSHIQPQAHSANQNLLSVLYTSQPTRICFMYCTLEQNQNLGYVLFPRTANQNLLFVMYQSEPIRICYVYCTPEQTIRICCVYSTGPDNSQSESAVCTVPETTNQKLLSVLYPRQPIRSCCLYCTRDSQSKSAVCTVPTSANQNMMSVLYPSQPIRICCLYCTL